MYNPSSSRMFSIDVVTTRYSNQNSKWRSSNLLLHWLTVRIELRVGRERRASQRDSELLSSTVSLVMSSSTWRLHLTILLLVLTIQLPMEAESSNIIIIEKLSRPVTKRNLPSQKLQDFVPTKRKGRFRNIIFFYTLTCLISKYSLSCLERNSNQLNISFSFIVLYEKPFSR